MEKIIISQPMNGLTDEQIKENRKRAIERLESEGYEVVNTLFEDEWTNPENMTANGIKNIPVAFLAKTIEVMATVDAVYFCDGWNKARGCCIEHEIALQYGITSIYESENVVTCDE